MQRTTSSGEASGCLLWLELELPGARLVSANRAARSLFAPVLATGGLERLVDSGGALEAVIADGDDREFECGLSLADGRRIAAYVLARKPSADRLELVFVPLAGDASRAVRDAAVLASVSHDLRGPLSTILTTTALLKMRLGEQAGPQLDKIERSAERMHRLIESLLDSPSPADDEDPPDQA